MPGFIERLLGKRDKAPVAPEEEKEPVLPYPVRDEMRASTLLPKELVRSLVRDGSSERPGFESAALYLTLKASSGDPVLETELLQELATMLAKMRESADTERMAAIRGFVESATARIPGQWSVDARNLARISRHGFHLTDELYKAHAARLAADSRNVVIVGHATFVGIVPLIDSFAKAGKRLCVVVPSFIVSEDSPIALTEQNHPTGYVIEPDGKVRALNHMDLESETGTVVVDDVRRTGKTEQQIRTYFEALGVTNADMEPLLDASGL